MTIDFDNALRESAIRMEEVGLHPYRLPLVRDWMTHHGRIAVREGWLVRVAGGRAVGIGDCSPLPEAGTEMADAALRVMERWCREASGARLHDLWSDLDALQSTPAARFAIEASCPLDGRDSIAGQSCHFSRNWSNVGRDSARQIRPQDRCWPSA